VLRRAFNLARQSTPPRIMKAPRVPALKENNVRKGFFEWTDFEKLRDALPAEVRPVVTFAFHTGCRKTEILSLRWEQVDLLERIVRLNPGETKNDEARMLPLSNELYTTLSFQRQIRDQRFPDCPWVFFRNGQQIRSIQDAWQTACERCRLVDAGGRPIKLFHDFRRSGVRNLIRAGVPERIAMAISGHKTRSVFDRYNIVSESDLKEAARRLDAYLDTRKWASSQESAHKAHTNTPNPPVI
jgi:integrase